MNDKDPDGRATIGVSLGVAWTIYNANKTINQVNQYVDEMEVYINQVNKLAEIIDDSCSSGEVKEEALRLMKEYQQAGIRTSRILINARLTGIANVFRALAITTLLGLSPI